MSIQRRRHAPCLPRTTHELNEMEKSFKRIKNYNVSVKEIDNKVIFLRKFGARWQRNTPSVFM